MSSSTPQRSFTHKAPSRNQKIYVPKNNNNNTNPSSSSSSSSSNPNPKPLANNNNKPSSSSSSSNPNPNPLANNTSNQFSSSSSSSKLLRPIPNDNPNPRSSLTASLRKPPPPSTISQDQETSGNLVNYLPQDEAVASGLTADAGALDAAEAQAVVDLANETLSNLLRARPRDFWREVTRSDSLHRFLDSYLQFRHRWYDFPHRGTSGTVAGVVVSEDALCRRVFMVLYRMSSNGDPGASASDCPSMKDHTALLQEKKLLDLPKLLDICAIYDHDNEELTRSLVTNAMKAQPQLVDNLSAVVSHFLSIVHTMHQRCSSSVEVLMSSGGPGDHGHGNLLRDFLEVMDFINDAVVTLDAFANAFKNASLYFSLSFEMSYGNEELLSTLARLHDSLIPTLYQGCMVVSDNCGVHTATKISGAALPNLTVCLRTLSLRIVRLGWKLLDFCYLRDEPIDDGLLQTTTKIFPAKVEDPAIRGDIIVQTFREINGEVLQNLPNTSGGTFLQNIELKYNVMSRIDHLRSCGWIFIDEDQFQFLYQIATPPHLLSWEKQKAAISLQNNKVHIDEDSIIIESKISQIKDLFPDYGNGFLSACLEAYNQNPEEVIQRILEGTLHKDLMSLDTSLEHIPPPSSIIQNQIDKGKGKIVESASQITDLPSKASQSSALPPKVDLMAGGKHVVGPSSSSTSGRFVRKSNDHHEVPDSKVLDSKADKDAIRSAVLDAEYEDEYDDSFDDLGLSVVGSGSEETEFMRDTTSSHDGKLWGSGNENYSRGGSSSSRWGSQKKAQFYVKDGKNYSYKVAGGVAVSGSQEAALVNQAQKETIHGLGRGGNLPLGAVKNLMDAGEQDQQNSDGAENPGRGGSNFRGRGGRRGGGGGNHYRKDRAMKKHFSSLGGQ